LDRDGSDLELDCGPTPSGVFDDVLLSCAGPTADEPDLAWQEGQRALAVVVEQPLCGQDALEVLQSGEKLADPYWANLTGIQVQGAALGPERRLGLDDDARTLGQRRGHRVQGGGADRDAEGHVDVDVPQGEVCRGLSRTPADLEHLTFDP
jgi:hypothetical protein